MTTIPLNTPVTHSDIIRLNIGDVVMISGTIFTARSKFHIRFVENDHVPPLDPRQHNVMLHSGPLMEKRESDWRVRAISVTTSIRFNKWEPETIRRLGLKVVIGKGKVGVETRDAFRKYGCIHLGKIGLFGGPLSTKVKAVEGVHWLDLGQPEAIWILRVKNFGPFVVTADTKGRCLFDRVSRHIHEQIPAISRRLGIDTIKFEEK